MYKRQVTCLVPIPHVFGDPGQSPCSSPSMSELENVQAGRCQSCLETPSPRTPDGHIFKFWSDARRVRWWPRPAGPPPLQALSPLRSSFPCSSARQSGVEYSEPPVDAGSGRNPCGKLKCGELRVIVVHALYKTGSQRLKSTHDTPHTWR